MLKQMRLLVVSGGMILAGTLAGASEFAQCPVTLATKDGKSLVLAPEELAGLKGRPLAEVKAKLTKEHSDPGFVTFNCFTVKPGTGVTGRYDLKPGDLPCRLTVYQISKEPQQPRKLRVVATGFHDKPETAEFRTTIANLEENVFLVTAEKVRDAADLNSHLRYMKSQDNEIILRGYGTNLTLSTLKFELAGKTGDQQEESFSHDAFWLVKQLTSPLWVVSIRAETN